MIWLRKSFRQEQRPGRCRCSEKEISDEVSVCSRRSCGHHNPDISGRFLCSEFWGVLADQRVDHLPAAAAVAPPARRAQALPVPARKALAACLPDPPPPAGLNNAGEDPSGAGKQRVQADQRRPRIRGPHQQPRVPRGVAGSEVDAEVRSNAVDRVEHLPRLLTPTRGRRAGDPDVWPHEDQGKSPDSF